MTALLKNPNGKQWLKYVAEKGGAKGIDWAFAFFAKKAPTEFAGFLEQPGALNLLKTITENGGAKGIGWAFIYFAKEIPTEFAGFKDKLKEQ